MSVEFGAWSIHIADGGAGLFCIAWRGWAVHALIPRRADWTWGVERGWYDGPLDTWSAGPLGMVAYCDCVHWDEP